MELYEQQKAPVEWKGGDVMLTKLGGWTSPNMEMVEVSHSHRIPRWWFVSNIYLNFSPRNYGDMMQFDEHIFQVG